jgi:hypothetical protein
MIDELKVPPEVVEFNIYKFLDDLGYHQIWPPMNIAVEDNNFVFCPPERV